MAKKINKQEQEVAPIKSEEEVTDTASKSEIALSENADKGSADTEAKSETAASKNAEEGANKDKEELSNTEEKTSLGAIAKDIFTNHQELNSLWITSDGQAFAEECYALDHSKNLKDKTVSKFVRTNA